jgi:hypothetical protein
MNWDLAYRPRGVYESTPITLQAASSAAAIAQLRAQIPADNLVLFVRAAS